MADNAQRTFRRMLKGAGKDEILIPVIRSLLYAPDFNSFEVPVAGFEDRPFDAWFHPSTHPLWTENMLYLYLTDHEILQKEPFDPLGTMAVTQGNFWHSFFQNLLFHHGFVRNSTPEGKSIHDKVELYVEDRETNTRGSMDGVLNSDNLPIDFDEGLELKTMVSSKLSKCPRTSASDPLLLAWFREKCSVYYAQAQEYLRMSGLSVQRVIIITLEYPFEMVEIAVPFDRGYSQSIVEKYRRVIQAVADGVMPNVP